MGTTQSLIDELRCKRPVQSKKCGEILDDITFRLPHQNPFLRGIIQPSSYVVRLFIPWFLCLQRIDCTLFSFSRSTSTTDHKHRRNFHPKTHNISQNEIHCMILEDSSFPFPNDAFCHNFNHFNADAFACSS